MTWGLGVALVVACILLQGFFSGSEMALVSASRARLETRSDEGHAGATLALELLRREDRLLGTCLIGTNICLVTGTVVFRRTLLGAGVTNDLLITALFVPLALLVGEALPKVVYRHHADLVAPVLARPIQWFSRLFRPLLIVVEAWTSALRRVAQTEEQTIRREDIVSLLEGESGSIDPENRQLITRLLGTADQTVEECMTPLVHLKAVPDDATAADAIELALQTGFSRLPVYRERVDNMIGHVEARDLLVAPRDDIPVVQLMRPVSFVPESKRIDELFREMRDERSPLRMVVDEWGGCVGVVTLEDLLEEILGDIEDERDRAQPGIRQIGPNEWRVPARVEAEELMELLGVEMPPGDYETVAGLLLGAVGRIPASGERIRIGRMVFHVDVASDRAIHTVRVVLTEGTPTES